MALGQAATVAQLVSAILQAVRTVRRNRKECRLLARRVIMVGDLLQLLQDSETTRRPGVRSALDGLGGALRQAYELVESCQEGSAVYGFIMAGRQADQFRDVQGEIDSYLLVFPVVSYIDITRRLDRIYNMLLPPDSQQVSEQATGSPTIHSEPDARIQENASEVIQLGNNQTIRELFEVGQHERAGHWEGMEELSTRDQRLKWLCWWPPSRKECPVFDLLKAATNNFSPENRLGVGGSAAVYKGVVELLLLLWPLALLERLLVPRAFDILETNGQGRYAQGQTRDGLEVAIKIFRGTNLDLQYETVRTLDLSCGTPPNLDLQYETECHVLAKLKHSNIIKLLGHYNRLGEKILVYEYMANGSLDKFIFDQGRGVSLDWSSRFQIIEGIAQGLLYLHTHTDAHIVHRDLKPSNILLDFGMNAKIGDFGVATMFSPGQHEDRPDAAVYGTLGYLAPECFFRGIGTISTKVDVYAFGVVLLEIISAKRSKSIREEASAWLDEYGLDLWITRRSVLLIDPSLRDEARTTEITRCIQIALLCVQWDPADRPTMSDVLEMLSSESISLPAPKGRDYFTLLCSETPSGYASDYLPLSDGTCSSTDFTLPR